MKQESLLSRAADVLVTQRDRPGTSTRSSLACQRRRISRCRVLVQLPCRYAQSKVDNAAPKRADTAPVLHLISTGQNHNEEQDYPAGVKQRIILLTIKISIFRLSR